MVRGRGQKPVARGLLHVGESVRRAWSGAEERKFVGFVGFVEFGGSEPVRSSRFTVRGSTSKGRSQWGVGETVFYVDLASNHAWSRASSSEA